MTAQATAQSAPDDLRAGGAYDTVSIAGFLLPIDDLTPLNNAQILSRNPDSQRFGFGPRITSERALRRALRDLPLEDPRAVRDLYRAAKVALPNGAAHTLTVPSGFGPAVFSNQRGGFAIGVGMGAVSRVPYTNDPDGALGIGLSFGNAFETLGATISLSMNDVSNITNTDRMSVGFSLSRYIFDGLSVSVGGENLLVRKTDGEASFYIAGSWAFDGDAGGLLPFNGVATLGIGSGRFAHKTPRDIAAGKGRNGTRVFGALAWEITETVNLIADWNGRNLTVGGSFRIPKTGLYAKIGVRDLTDNTGDGPRLTASIGFTLARF